MYEITTPQPADAAQIESLLDLAFGPDRHRKTAYRYRDGVEPVSTLGLVARSAGRLVGTIRYWPVVIGDAGAPALLLGPIAVAPDRRGDGIGVALIERSLATAARDGHRIVVLVGDRDYYGRFGFRAAAEWGIVMPGEPDRVMARELVDGALGGVSGLVLPWRSVRRRMRAA